MLIRWGTYNLVLGTTWILLAVFLSSSVSRFLHPASKRIWFLPRRFNQLSDTLWQMLRGIVKK